MGVTLFVGLIVENGECRAQWTQIIGPLILWGVFAGGVGSLVRLFYCKNGDNAHGNVAGLVPRRNDTTVALLIGHQASAPGSFRTPRGCRYQSYQWDRYPHEQPGWYYPSLFGALIECLSASCDRSTSCLQSRLLFCLPNLHDQSAERTGYGSISCKVFTCTVWRCSWIALGRI